MIMNMSNKGQGLDWTGLDRYRGSRYNVTVTYTSYVITVSYLTGFFSIFSESIRMSVPWYVLKFIFTPTQSESYQCC